MLFGALHRLPVEALRVPRQGEAGEGEQGRGQGQELMGVLSRLSGLVFDERSGRVRSEMRSCAGYLGVG